MTSASSAFTLTSDSGAAEARHKPPSLMSLPAAVRHFLAFVLPAILAAAAPSGPLLLDAARAGDAIVAVGEDGLVLRRAEPDAEWERLSSGAEATLTGVSFATGETGWAVGHDGLVLQTTDGGQTWTAVPDAGKATASYLDVLALSERHVIAIGGFGAYLETRDGGQRWRSRRIIDEKVHLNRISRDTHGTLYIAADRGVLLRSTNDGRRWERLASVDGHPFHDVLPLKNDTLLAFGPQGRVYRSTDRGDTWSRVETRTDALILTGIELDDGTVVLAGQPQLCLVSRDGGESFTATRHAVPAIAKLLIRHDRELLSFGDGGVHALSVP